MSILALLEMNVQGIMSRTVLCNVTNHIPLITLFKEHFIWNVLLLYTPAKTARCHFVSKLGASFEPMFWIKAGICIGDGYL